MSSLNKRTANELWNMYMKAMDEGAILFARIYLDCFWERCERYLERIEEEKNGTF